MPELILVGRGLMSRNALRTAEENLKHIEWACI
jgi:hypothetical protein